MNVFLLSPAYCGGRRAKMLLNPASRMTLARDLREGRLSLGAAGKYVDVLEPFFGGRLYFPSAFVGRGDMSRGGLMLRASRSGVELEYAPITQGQRPRGRRPPKLTQPTE